MHKWIFYIEPYGKVYFVIKLILALFTNLLGIIYPFLLGYMIDSIFYQNNWTQFIKYIIFYIVIFVIHQFFNIIIEKLNLQIKKVFTNSLKKFLFNKAITAKAIHLSYLNSADLINIINKESEDIIKFFDEIILSTAISYIYIGVLFILIATFSWELAFAVLFFSVLTVYLADISKKKFQVLKKEYRSLYGEFLGWVTETLNGMQDIRVNKAEEMMNITFKDYVVKLLKKKEKARFLEIKAQRLNGFFTILFTLAFWTLSAMYVINNRITVGLFYIIEKYFNTITTNIDKIKQAKINYHNYQPSFEKVWELYQCSCENIEDEKSISGFSIAEYPLLFEDVVFQYTEKPVINHLNITIKKGEFLSIVGSNGEGKSTLFGLITKFYDVQSGCIKLGDYDINEISTKELRNQIGYVQQNTVIFEGTLEDNLRLYNDNATETMMWDALKKCGLYNTVIKWENGLKTNLMNGERISGGQKQRIAFARVLIKNPQIVLMDEPTSALDNETERLIIKDIKHIFEGKTLIMISHRPVAAHAADRIAVLQNGKFIDIGTNAELMERCQTYKQLFQNYQSV